MPLCKIAKQIIGLSDLIISGVIPNAKYCFFSIYCKVFPNEFFTLARNVKYYTYHTVE